jgi:hypothetical protein
MSVPPLVAEIKSRPLWLLQALISAYRQSLANRRLAMRRWLIALALTTGMISLPVMAQQKVTSPTDLAVPPLVGTPAPGDSGKPVILAPPSIIARPDDAIGCVPGLPCGTRLTGAVQKNGAVAIEFPALKW